MLSFVLPEDPLDPDYLLEPPGDPTVPPISEPGEPTPCHRADPASAPDRVLLLLPKRVNPAY